MNLPRDVRRVALLLGLVAVFTLVGPARASAEGVPYHSYFGWGCVPDVLGTAEIKYIYVGAPVVRSSARSDLVAAGGGYFDENWSYIPAGTPATGSQNVFWRAKIAWWTGGGWAYQYAPYWMGITGGFPGYSFWERWTGSGFTALNNDALSGSLAHFVIPVFPGTYWVGQDFYWSGFDGASSTDWANRYWSEWNQVVTCHYGSGVARATPPTSAARAGTVLHAAQGPGEPQFGAPPRQTPTQSQGHPSTSGTPRPPLTPRVPKTPIPLQNPGSGDALTAIAFQAREDRARRLLVTSALVTNARGESVSPENVYCSDIYNTKVNDDRTLRPQAKAVINGWAVCTYKFPKRKRLARVFGLRKAGSGWTSVTRAGWRVTASWDNYDIRRGRNRTKPWRYTYQCRTNPQGKISCPVK